MNNYNLDFMIETFISHAKKWETQKLSQLEQLKKDYPEKEIPELFNDDFNLPAALAVMCDEVKKLKDNENGKKKDGLMKKSEDRFEKFSNLKGSSFSDEDIIELMIFALSRRALPFEKSNPDTRLFTFRVYDEYIRDYEAGLLSNATETNYKIIKDAYQQIINEFHPGM